MNSRLDIDEKKIKLFSTIGPRATFGLAMLDVVKLYKNIILLTSDVSTSAGLDRFRNQYKENYIDVGISEQNLINVATGLSKIDFNVITTTFAPFQTMRCLEQIKVNQGYMKNKIVMVGLASGLVLGPLGYTHCCIEDIGVLRSIPNITIISPADTLELVKSLEASILYNEPVYIRLTGGQNSGIIYDKDYNFKIGTPVTLQEGKEGIILSNGSITYNCLQAVKKLKDSYNMNFSLVNVHTIKPLNEKYVLEACKNKKYIITVEEHSLIGGLKSAVSEVLVKSKTDFKNFKSLGINDKYEYSGTYNYMLDKHGLSVEKIVNFIKQLKN